MAEHTPAEEGQEAFRAIVAQIPAALYIVGADGTLMYANQAAEAFSRALGLPESAVLVGREISEIGNENLPDHFVNDFRHVLETCEVFVKEFTEKATGGHYRAIFSPLFENEQLKHVLAIVQDVTLYREETANLAGQASALADTLRQQEFLIREAHHRIKNSLAVVAGMLQTQAMTTDMPAVANSLKKATAQIIGISLIHEKLYQPITEEGGKIDFSGYLPELAFSIQSLYRGAGRDIALRFNLGKVSMGAETAIPCALIVSELMTNAYKHAFGKRKEGEISIRLESPRKGWFLLEVADNGSGCPPDFDWEKAKGMGMQVLRGLTRQLRGEMEVKCQNGMCFRLNAPLP